MKRAATSTAENGSALWKNPVAYLKAMAPNAAVQPVKETCYGAWVVDVGDADYERLMLEQAARHIEKLTDAAGLCIDRLDWLACYNLQAETVSVG